MCFLLRPGATGSACVFAFILIATSDFPMVSSFSIPDTDFAKVVVAEYPDLAKPETSDLERATMLRQWAWSHIDYAPSAEAAKLFQADADWVTSDAPEYFARFEKLEGGEQFVRTPWNHVSGGGGEMAVLRGKVFEKAAVNFSAVEGPSFPMQDGSGPYFATGVSLITHMQNPHAPTVHMNIRYIRTEETAWFAGHRSLDPGS